MATISKYKTPDGLQVTFSKKDGKYSYRITRIGNDRTPIPDERYYQLQNIAEKIKRRYEFSHLSAHNS